MEECLTFISLTAVTSLETVRATTTTFAPFADSSSATALPMPSEPPVITTVCKIQSASTTSITQSCTYLPLDIELVSGSGTEHFSDSVDNDSANECGSAQYRG